MEELVSKLEEILEVDNLDVSKKFMDYEEWDSLAALSILALLDSDYKMAMKVSDLKNYASIEAFCQNVLSKMK